MKWGICPEFSEYLVSEDGVVKRRISTPRGHYPAGYRLTERPHPRGYRWYGLQDDTGRARKMLTHRLVALTFLGLPPTEKHEVAHNDGTRTNNHYSNLRWALPKENAGDRRGHGTWLDNEKVKGHKLKNVQVEEIRTRYAQGGTPYRRNGTVTMQGFADEYGLSIAQISRIVNGHRRPPVTP